MILPLNISNEDFFKLLKHKIPTSYSTRYTGALSEKIIFKETIEALKGIADFAQEVSDDIWDIEVFISKFRHQKDHQQLADFCQLFDAIRLQKDLFPYPEIFNHLFFKSVYGTYVQLDKDTDHDIRKKYGIFGYLSLSKEKQEEYAKAAFIYDTHHQITPWMTRDIPYERIAQMIAQVGYQIEHGMNDHREQEKKVFDKLIQHAQIFDHLLGVHSSLNVFTIDIRIQDFLKPRSDLLTQVGGVHSPIHDIKLILTRFPDLLNGLTKIETHGAKEDLNLHCILILKPSKNFSEKKSIDVLQQQIQNFLGNSYYVSIRNWNEVIRRNYSKIAVGLIKKSQPKNAEAFKYWVLSFFFTLDLYIQPKLPNHLKNHLATNETLDAYPKTVVADKLDLNPKNYISMESSLKELEKANKALSKANQPFLSESERKSVWSTRSLSKTSQAYIEAVKHYYCEIESDPETLQSMIHIEIFIETLVTTRLMAFELSVSGDQEMLTRQVLHGAITRLGKQFILLGESKLENPVIRTKQDFELHENGLIQNSREALQQLTSLQVSKESIRRINSSILNLRRIFTEMSFGYNNKSIKETRINAYRKYKKRLEVATILFQHLMKQDCLIFRLTVELILESKFITQEKLAILWTAFLHHAQRAKPLSWKTGYFGLWRQNEKGHFYADVFIVFDDRAFTDPTSIINVLNKKLAEFIKAKAHLILEVDEKPNFKSCKIQGKSIMQTNEEYSLDRLLIESTNKQRKSDFLQKIVPTFLSHSIFIENTMNTNSSNYHNSDAKLLIKSSIAVASRKNAPTPKLMKKIVPKVPVDHSEIDEDQ